MGISVEVGRSGVVNTVLFALPQISTVPPTSKRLIGTKSSFSSRLNLRMSRQIKKAAKSESLCGLINPLHRTHYMTDGARVIEARDADKNVSGPDLIYS